MRQVMAGLEHLSDDRREALIMRFSLGMSNREIARALGRSDGATKVLIHRSIKQLEEELRARRGRAMSERPVRVRSTSRRCSPTRCARSSRRSGSAAGSRRRSRS